MENIGLGMVLAGSAGGALVTALGNVIQWGLNRRAKKKDTKTMNVEQLCAKVLTIEEGQRVILHDRIKYLARSYITEGEVDYDDFNDLKDMHKVYQKLGGENLVRPLEDVAKCKMLYK
jgi:hypothetical protein